MGRTRELSYPLVEFCCLVPSSNEANPVLYPLPPIVPAPLGNTQPKRFAQNSYVWEEPLFPPRLLVRVGPDFLRGGDLHRGDGGSAPAVAAARLQAWGVGRVSSEEAGTLSGQIKLIR